MNINYAVLILGFALGFLSYYFFDILILRIKKYLIERKDKARRKPSLIFYKYTVGSSAFYKDYFVGIIGLKKTSNGIFYLIKPEDARGEIFVSEDELSDKPKKGRSNLK